MDIKKLILQINVVVWTIGGALGLFLTAIGKIQIFDLLMLILLMTVMSIQYDVHCIKEKQDEIDKKNY